MPQYRTKDGFILKRIQNDSDCGGCHFWKNGCTRTEKERSELPCMEKGRIYYYFVLAKQAAIRAVLR